MKLYETKVNEDLGIDNRNININILRNKLLEEATEVAIALDKYYRDPASKERADHFYEELYDTLLILLTIIKRLKEDTGYEESEKCMYNHREKLRDRGWEFGGYWDIQYISENRRKAIKISEDIMKRKHDKYYEISDYIRDKKPGVGRNNEV